MTTMDPKVGGALSGAVAGGAAGTAFGPWGTVIGAGVGAIAGYIMTPDGPKPVDANGTIIPFNSPDLYYGPQPQSMGNLMNTGEGMRKGFLGQDGMQYATSEAEYDRGPMAIENQQLSNNDAYDRGYDQSGALQLAREAAMGQAPSQAQYQMQEGLDQALASQQAQMGSARGSAGIALASGNAAANSAALQNQTYNQAAQLRAQEMATARGLYGGLAGQMREQDLNRLGMGNQMSQFNTGQDNSYRLGMLGAGAQYGQLGLGAYSALMHPADMQAGLDTAQANIDAASYNAAQGRGMGAQEFNAGLQQHAGDNQSAMFGNMMDSTGQMVNSYADRQKAADAAAASAALEKQANTSPAALGAPSTGIGGSDTSTNPYNDNFA